ncbi:hypothetical protein GDO81_001000 [Engystomops pustulosus]|uniref:Uncharacterized protein n=1 Tax=Engystomops pustulosus TaxID=76066 RepID=A0AAV7D915_ENGPU|nr:hypothetical protein GDO81_001000 [Engystomops pustulosus]
MCILYCLLKVFKVFKSGRRPLTLRSPPSAVTKQKFAHWQKGRGEEIGGEKRTMGEKDNIEVTDICNMQNDINENNNQVMNY